MNTTPEAALEQRIQRYEQAIASMYAKTFGRQTPAGDPRLEVKAGPGEDQKEIDEAHRRYRERARQERAARNAG